MKKALGWRFSVVLLAAALVMTATLLSEAAEGPRQADNSIYEFWTKFRAAVIKGDKVGVAGLTRFPVELPYGMGILKNRAQLMSRYRTVFNGEANAAKCFGTAKPQIDPANPKLFTVGCKNAAGDEVVIYSFARTANGWKFAGLDNINE
ncbi:MAG: hypothetical protein AABN95_17265 [Acidobacteriota bacterium]